MSEGGGKKTGVGPSGRGRPWGWWLGLAFLFGVSVGPSFLLLVFSFSFYIVSSILFFLLALWFCFLSHRREGKATPPKRGGQAAPRHTETDTKRQREKERIKKESLSLFQGQGQTEK